MTRWCFAWIIAALLGLAPAGAHRLLPHPPAGLLPAPGHGMLVAPRRVRDPAPPPAAPAVETIARRGAPVAAAGRTVG